MKLLVDFFHFIAAIVAFGIDFFKGHYEASISVMMIFFVIVYLLCDHKSMDRDKNRFPHGWGGV